MSTNGPMAPGDAGRAQKRKRFITAAVLVAAALIWAFAGARIYYAVQERECKNRRFMVRSMLVFIGLHQEKNISLGEFYADYADYYDDLVEECYSHFKHDCMSEGEVDAGCIENRCGSPESVEDIKCPLGGDYDLGPGKIITCSIHGK